MKLIHLSKQFSTSGQIVSADIQTLKDHGISVLICNRPDDEEKDQPTMAEIAHAAKQEGLTFIELPFASGDSTVAYQKVLLKILKNGERIHAYCRTGNRSKNLWQEANALQETSKSNDNTLNDSKFDVVIIGAGSAGVAVAASLRKRLTDASIALIDPSDAHYYQPGWTMVGSGVFSAESTKRRTAEVIPDNCTWIKDAVTQLKPNADHVILSGGESIHYSELVVALGLKLNWAGIEGLEETLGSNGVTSNYRFDLAPYTWELVQKFDSGKAIFTQPPMPIKCAGAPQKAMYLSASHWLNQGKLNDIDLEFHTAGNVLFGVEAYLPSLMEYVHKYQAQLCFSSTLVKVDGYAKKAWFKDAEGVITASYFDLLHVCPPQIAPKLIRQSELSDENGWLDVDPATLQNRQYNNIWGVGDVLNTSNAKTMAAARKQAPVVAYNITQALHGQNHFASYDGYGSCPLAVEHGKVVLAEFTYGGNVSPSLPTWLNDGTKPTSTAWFLKTTVLPALYWHGMLKGHEWLASPSV